MSTSEPRRRRVARPSSVRSKTMRCPGRNILKMLPSRAFSANSYSARSVSQSNNPVFVPGSKAFTTPCMTGRLFRRGRGTPDLGDLAGANATGAHMKSAGGSVDQGPDSLDIGIPATLSPHVRMGNGHTPRGVFLTHVANCSHDLVFLQYPRVRNPTQTSESGGLPERLRYHQVALTRQTRSGNGGLGED